ncbi:uncharacterized protein LOC105861583 [Microcebus murinus]|uniref:uncharacterized protein LOC105861583 n=1 Tax=Microcebus murinus TaxID=30608 RepID=UPI003F6BC5A6
MVMEYASHGDVYDYLQEVGRMHEEEAREKFRQVVSAVDYCHRMSVVHRDLKPENLLLDTRDNIKITDFGLSAQFTMGTPLQTCCGTTLYMAPEILEGKKYHGPTADVWSLGVVLYVFVTGTVPFTGDSPKELIRKVRTGKYSVPSCISKECKNLLKGLLVVNPQGRRSLQKIMDDEWVNLEHTEKLTPYVEEAITRDEKRIEILLRMGYEEEDIEKSLQQQQPDEINATYRLLEETSDENNTTPGVTTEGRQNSTVSTPAPPAAENIPNIVAENIPNTMATAPQLSSQHPASWHGFTLHQQEEQTPLFPDCPAIRSLSLGGKPPSGFLKSMTKLRRSPAPSEKVHTAVATPGGPDVPSDLDLNTTFHGQQGEQPNHSPPASPNLLHATPSPPTQSPGFFRKLLGRFRKRTFPQEGRRALSARIPSGSPPGEVPLAEGTSSDTSALGQPQDLQPAPPDCPPASPVPSRHSVPASPPVRARRSLFSRFCCCVAADGTSRNAC